MESYKKLIYTYYDIRNELSIEKVAGGKSYGKYSCISLSEF